MPAADVLVLLELPAQDDGWWSLVFEDRLVFSDWQDLSDVGPVFRVDVSDRDIAVERVVGVGQSGDLWVSEPAGQLFVPQVPKCRTRSVDGFGEKHFR